MGLGCLLNIGVVGLNFKTADLPLREAVARGVQGLLGEKALFFHHPTLVLSTCNRTEIYFSANDLAEAHHDLLTFLRGQIEVPFEQKLYSFFGFDCFLHLSRVASGLESAILAETEIQKQVKTAYRNAAKIFAFPGSFHYVFQKALRISKGVRSQFGFGRGAPHLFSTLWDLAIETFPDLKERKILLVGYSEIHRGFASFLEKRGIRQFVFVTTDPARLEGALGRDALAHWREFDLISSASVAEGYLIEKTEGAKEHLIFDLSMPRTVDPEVGMCDGVSLFNIEEIGRIIEERRVSIKRAILESEELVVQHASRLARLYRDKVKEPHLYLLRGSR